MRLMQLELHWKTVSTNISPKIFLPLHPVKFKRMILKDQIKDMLERRDALRRHL